jgi:CheY-like chemotaxis protein
VTPSVLVIEDDPDIRERVVSLLHDEAPWVSVTSAGDGMEALELLEDGPAPCLALLDIMMPVMNGLEFLDALRDRGLAPEMHVVLVSAYVQLARQVKYPGVTGCCRSPSAPRICSRSSGSTAPRPGTAGAGILSSGACALSA